MESFWPNKFNINDDLYVFSLFIIHLIIFIVKIVIKFINILVKTFRDELPNRIPIA